MRARHTVPVLLLSLLFAASPSHSVEDAMYLWVLDQQELPDEAQLDEAAVVLELQVRDPAQVASSVATSTSLDVIGTSTETVRIIAAAGATINGAPNARHLASSFVIDYDEAAVVSLVEDFAVAYDGTPSAEELRVYVFKHVSETKYARGFDLASRVAASGEGDCTEHAVLLSALARAVGYPARVVFGVLLMEQGNAVQSFGHAWTEVHVDGAWQIVDSTLGTDLPETWVRHVPLLELTEEGPGFGMTLLDLSTILPSGVRISPYED